MCIFTLKQLAHKHFERKDCTFLLVLCLKWVKIELDNSIHITEEYQQLFIKYINVYLR